MQDEGNARMSTLTIDVITSLDGYGAAEGWPGLWGLGGPEYFAWLASHPDRDAPIVMGAVTYRLMSGFAESGEEDMGTLEQVPKYVCSNSLPEPLTWPNSTLVRGDAVTEVAALKRREPVLRTLGSVSLCRSLLRGGLVDRFRIVIFPVINGQTGHDRIYDDYPEVALELLESRVMDGRLQLLEYRPTLLDGPPQP